MRQTTHLLHDEHLATIALLDRLEGLLARNGPGKAPDPSDGTVGRLLADLVASLSNETGRHFDFEEGNLFPRLDEAGDGFISQLLKEEHTAIRPLAGRLAALAGDARASGFSAEDWSTFHRLGLELVERQISHIQKEEMGLLPRLEDLLSDDDDIDLAARYAGDG